MKTKWNVITGAPSSGKTSVIEQLSHIGYTTVPEAARSYIDNELANGRTIEDIRRDPAKFQAKLLEMKKELENQADPNELTFFDRGIPDSKAYHKFHGLEIPRRIIESCHPDYQNVFIMDTLPFKADYSRTENPEEATRLHQLIREAYLDIGYNPITVPVDTVMNRTQFIIAHALSVA